MERILWKLHLEDLKDAQILDAVNVTNVADLNLETDLAFRFQLNSFCVESRCDRCKMVNQKQTKAETCSRRYSEQSRLRFVKSGTG